MSTRTVACAMLNPPQGLVCIVCSCVVKIKLNFVSKEWLNILPYFSLPCMYNMLDLDCTGP